MRNWIVGAILLVAMGATGQTLPTERVLRWVPGLEYTSGGAFDESQIESYTLYCDGAVVASLPNDFTRSTTVTTELLGAGDHTCGVSETVAGIESVMSNTVDFPLGQRTPTAPTLTVE